MNRRDLVLDFFVVVALGFVFLFIDHRISAGIVTGFIFALINYKLIERRYQNLDKVSISTYLGIFLSTFVLIIPLFISVLFPAYLNWIGVLIGLLTIKASIIVKAVLEKG